VRDDIDAGTRRLVIVTQVYPPDPAAVGQHLEDVAREMVQRGWRVDVVTADRGYDDPTVRYASRETRHGVSIRRVPLSSFGKRRLAVRLAAQSLFVMQAMFLILWMGSVTRILVSTSPPFAGFCGAMLSAFRGVPFTWWVMDINPDQLIRIGKASPRSILVRLFNWMNTQSLGRASDVIVLDDVMKEVMLRKARQPVEMHVIPPWAGTDCDDPPKIGSNPLRVDLNVDEQIVIMYSGNHAITSPLTTLLHAIRSNGPLHGLAFVFVGGGYGKADVDSLIKEFPGLPVHSLPYQPREALQQTLAAADVHVVSLADHAIGVVHPCKIYGAMAAARPILAIASADSFIGEIVEGNAIGWRVSQGDVDGLLAALRTIQQSGRSNLRDLGKRARQTFIQKFARNRGIAAVCDVIERRLRGHHAPERGSISS